MDEACAGGTKEEEPEASESSAASLSTSRLISWRPKPLAFRPYSSITENNAKPHLLRVVVRKPLVARLTKDIVEIYQICNPQFHYSTESNLKRFLTSPSTGLLNDGCDNANSDLILTPNYLLVNSETKQRYVVKDVLGHGTFGQVAKCWVAETNSFVAVKIIKNLPAYYQQALVEVSILTALNKKFDPEDKHHIVRIYDYFVYQRHLCIAFELLDTNLYELIKMNQFRGLPLNVVQLFSKQILRGLALMKDAGIIHCDLKPENILLWTSVKPVGIKIIDFGSACMEDRTVYSYIQSRYYRSPEVLLGYQYTTAIDMWSFGCIVAELFLGLPLFPGASEFDLLKRMIKILGGQPPDYILRKAKNTSRFFKFVGSINHAEIDPNHKSNCSMYQVLTGEEYAARESKKPSIGKEYFNHMNLDAIVTKYPYKKDLAEEDVIRESQIRLALIDFLRGLVEFDPAKRWSPLQASKHPFLTGEPFTCPYKPIPETPHMLVSQNVKVDHHPAGGHWFAAGLSPNISGRNRAVMQNSPHYQLMSYVHPGSYGSLGSHGSYNDGLGLGSSYGSYGDSNNLHVFYSPAGPSGMSMYAKSGISVIGNSPDTRRMMPHPHGNGIGFSPGNFAPMSLGSSPSQFTPPNSYSQISAGSPSGHYGPPSPLGKTTSGSHYNRRKNWAAFHGNYQSQETLPDASTNSCRQSEGNNCAFVGSPSTHHNHRQHSNPPTWRSQGSGSITTSSHTLTLQDKSEASNSLPDPADWDPNYSEELLLQEDNSDVNSMTSGFDRGMHLSEPSISEPLIGTRGSNRSTSSSVSRQRHEVPPPVQSSCLGGASSNPAIYGYNAQMRNQSYFVPNMSQSSPGVRLGQQPVQWHNHSGRSSSAQFRDGRRGSYSVSNAPPAFHGRKDCGRNA